MKLAYASAACLLTSLAAAGEPLRLEPHTVRDPMVRNRPAVTFLKPAGWNVEGGVKWYPNLAHQACVEVRVFNPAGPEQIEALPWAYGTWMTNPVIPMQPGTNYMGAVVLQPIEDPKEFVRRITLPYLRAKPNPRITGYTELPEVAKALSAGLGGAKVRSGRVRVEYELNGQAVEEDFYVSLSVASMPLGVNNCVAYSWGPAWPPFALRAAKGKLDAATPLMLASVNSGRLDQDWFSEYRLVCDLFRLRMANDIENARRLSETVRRNAEEMRRMYSDSFRQRQESQDRMAQRFCDAVRGVERFDSPFETHPIQLPGGYSQAWASPNGTYLLSNDAGYNPNVGSTTEWRLLAPAK